MATTRGIAILRNTAAATVLLGAGIGIGEADFRPHVRYRHMISEGRQVPVGNANCTRLDTIDAATGSDGVIDAHAISGDPGACWQVDGIQVPVGHANCGRLDNIAALIIGPAATRDELSYTAARFIAKKITGDPGACWQAEAAMAIQMICVPE